ncbi:DUF2383 domain-containing protein [Clostridium sp.]|uniref:DUF2383 domain-containing protein n=1 Tax=Clostridium sp. TaxID=1506 RepID=UPI00346430C9
MSNDINDFIRGVYMGVDTFSNLAEKCDDPALKSLLTETSLMYEKHKNTLKSKLKDDGIETTNTSGIFGKVTETIYEIKSMFSNNPEEIRSEAKRSLKTGIEMSERFLSSYERGDNETTLLIKGIIEDSKSMLQKYD